MGDRLSTKDFDDVVSLQRNYLKAKTYISGQPVVIIPAADALRIMDFLLAVDMEHAILCAELESMKSSGRLIRRVFSLRKETVRDTVRFTMNATLFQGENPIGALSTSRMCNVTVETRRGAAIMLWKMRRELRRASDDRFGSGFRSLRDNYRNETLYNMLGEARCVGSVEKRGN